MEINDGGPAFQQPCNEYGIDSRGMTLRDYFAAHMAETVFASFQADGTVKEFYDWRKGVAVEAYRIADAMLIERERKHE